MTHIKQHGTRTGYVAGCRETCCRTANNEYMRQYRATLRKREVPDHLHGTLNAAKNYGCRCPACRKAEAAHYKRWQATGAAQTRNSLPADWTW